MKKILFILILTAFFLTIKNAYAQFDFKYAQNISIQNSATDEASTASISAKEKINSKTNLDVTKPEGKAGKEEILALFSKRPENKLTFLNFIAYFVQYSVKSGVPANSILLILLIPFLATMIAFFRHVIGLPSLDMLVTISLSITLLATGLTTGILLLATIILASFLSRILLKKVRIMQLPKIALSILIVAISVFAVLTISASIGILAVKEISIFPILLLIILSEKIVALQLERTINEIISITVVTLCLGIIGYFVLSSEVLRQIVLLYPEVILVHIPVNLIIGRYFGLRLTEYLRFAPITQHAGK